MYQKNLLAQRRKRERAGERLDLGKIKIPVYLQASREDHIAPYRSVYKATHLYGGPVRFMLAGSGHIAGVINHPKAKKYQHWLNDTKTNRSEEHTSELQSLMRISYAVFCLKKKKKSKKRTIT